MTMPTREQQIDELLAKQQIHEAIMRYCRGIDRCDAELVRDCYHPDATDQHGGFKGSRDEFVAWAMKDLRRYISTTHAICNEMVEIDGDLAHSESYFFACHRMQRKDGEYDLIAAGRYVDRFERRNGEWKIAHRIVVLDWNRLDKAGSVDPSKNAPFVRGLRSREDLAYRR